MVYEGDFKDGMRNGEGEWRKSQANNQAQNHTQQYQPECDVYQGNYLDDKKHGYGFYQWVSGDSYKGHFANDQRNGYGEMYWNDGSIYKGDWKEGIQHGYGQMTYSDGTVKSGTFINNMYIDSNSPI